MGKHADRANSNIALFQMSTCGAASVHVTAPSTHPNVHPALHPNSIRPAPHPCHFAHSVTSMFIPPIAQSRKPSWEPKNKKSILAATFLRLAIVPSRRITDQGAKAQVICPETSDSCFAWGERELLIAKKLQKYLDFCFDNGGSAVAERIPQKIGSRQQQRSRYREIGGYRATHHQRLNPIRFFK